MDAEEQSEKATGRRIGLRQAVTYLDAASEAAVPKSRSTKMQRAIGAALKKAADEIHEMRKKFTDD